MEAKRRTLYGERHQLVGLDYLGAESSESRSAVQVQVCKVEGERHRMIWLTWNLFRSLDACYGPERSQEDIFEAVRPM